MVEINDDRILDRVRSCNDEKELFKYLNLSDLGILVEMAKSKNVTPGLLDSLATNPNVIIRHEVVKNKNLSLESLKKLSLDQDMLVRDYAKRTILIKKIEFEEAEERAESDISKESS